MNGPGPSSMEVAPPIRPVEAPKAQQPEANLINKARERLGGLFGRRQEIKQDIKEGLGPQALTAETKLASPDAELKTAGNSDQSETESPQIGNITVNHDTTPIHIPASEPQTNQNISNEPTPIVQTSEQSNPTNAKVESQAVNASKSVDNSENVQSKQKTEETSDKPHAQPEQIKLTTEQQKALEELRAKYPDNPLFDNDFKEVPENYVSVYHIMTEPRLAESGVSGLLPRADYLKTHDLDRAKVDEEMDKVAPEGFSRTESVYAYSSLEEMMKQNGVNINRKARQGPPKNIILEIKVDPSKVRISDGEYLIQGKELLDMGGGGAFESYWDESMPLDKYRSLKPNERPNFENPEVIIPGGIKQEFMRVASILPLTEPTN